MCAQTTTFFGPGGVDFEFWRVSAWGVRAGGINDLLYDLDPSLLSFRTPVPYNRTTVPYYYGHSRSRLTESTTFRPFGTAMDPCIRFL